MKNITQFAAMVMILITSSQFKAQSYQMPIEDELHEGTWLQWPHQYEYGIAFRNRLDATWVAMTGALVGGEKVHIIAYNMAEQNRITNLLTTAGLSLANVDFNIFPTNDVWVRDNGPIFVRDSNGDLNITDWGFNGWGGDYNFDLCNPIPTSVGNTIGVPVVNLNAIMTLEGGSFEIDGSGVLMATRTSIISQSNTSGAFSIRNPGMTQSQAEAIFTQYIGASKFVWLNGFLSSDDVTDAHIDGFAKFAPNNSLVTMSNSDLTYWGLSSADIATLYAASNASDVVYTKVYLPLTQNNVVTTFGLNLGYKGSYCNYYVANESVLVPNYNDSNDAVANAIIQGLYPSKTVIGIDCRNLYQNGGMVHCVTQQQPVASETSGFNQHLKEELKVGRNFPNPFSDATTIELSLDSHAKVQVFIYNALGQIASNPIDANYDMGAHTLQININDLAAGVYTYSVSINGFNSLTGKMLVAK